MSWLRRPRGNDLEKRVSDLRHALDRNKKILDNLKLQLYDAEDRIKHEQSAQERETSESIRTIHAQNIRQFEIQRDSYHRKSMTIGSMNLEYIKAIEAYELQSISGNRIDVQIVDKILSLQDEQDSRAADVSQAMSELGEGPSNRVHHR